MQRLTKTVHNKTEYPERVLQFGTGNFLRAFTDWMIHRMNKETDFNGSVVVVQSTKRGAAEVINEQDGLYSLFLQGMLDGRAVRRHEVIESISRALNVHDQYDEYLALATSPDLRFVVSNTTEAGIAFDEKDQLESRPQSSFPGKLTALLWKRFTHFNGDPSKGLVVIPCELIDQNGTTLKNIVLRYAKAWQLGEIFAEWIDNANTFCNSLVDRIVPGYPKDEKEELERELGCEDQLMTVGEHYHLWAIEGPEWLREEFPAHRAGLNVKVIDDLAPYRLSKVYILNGAHTALTPIALLSGIETVKETVTRGETKAFVEELIFQEIIPAAGLPKEETIAFANQVLSRFANPFVHHYVKSIALNAMPKFKTRNVPLLIKHTEAFGEVPERIALALAAWIHVYKTSETDEAPIVALFRGQWDACDGTDEGIYQLVENVLAYEALWEQDLNQIPRLTETVARLTVGIEREGMMETLQKAGASYERHADHQRT
ncbi:tagaturonate reductase [Domibacillus robiginosus]|uniref:tagaturonate reductase n=1 Tax=Domibacillus robiginosus TaxID=1071054 RepID=UPI000B21CF76|nr:tagaturonate reductase [Domibacillus robiginosus]